MADFTKLDVSTLPAIGQSFAMSAPDRFEVTPQTRVRRSPARASYERTHAHAILDEALVAAVGFVQDGQPFVIPLAVARDGERLLLHAASSSRVGDVLRTGARICVTVTLLDGIVFARSAMHHSLNYRSVVILGSATELVAEHEKRPALARVVDHVLPGRSGQCRPPDAVELKATSVFALALEEVSVKCRRGGPLDDAEDLALPHWAGVVPLAQQALPPVADARDPPRAPLPDAIASYRRGSGPEGP
jgi:nitroimidazol reductase NimA-like FMN-containing flavoprotein (pyridoxamine 5'-phosphate oxidase superfamily)